MSLRAARLAALALVAALAGCGGAKAAVGISEANEPARVKRDVTRDPVRSHALATVVDRTIGPFVARREGPRGKPEAATALAAWVTPPEGSGRRIVAAGLSAAGAPRGGERTVAHVPIDTTMLEIGAVKGEHPGFMVAWTSLTDRGEALWAAVIGDDGVPRSKALELARTGDDVVWMDVVPTEKGALCIWAEETRAGDATLVAAAIDGEGKVIGVPARVARGVVGWHALEIPGGVGVSVVSASATAKPGAGRSRGGTLAFHRLDADGHPTVGPAVVSAAPTVSGDVEVALEGERVVFAWTDRTGDEPFVAGAALALHPPPAPAPAPSPEVPAPAPGVTAPSIGAQKTAGLETPRKIVDARGGASLLGIATGKAGTAILWESPFRAKSTTRRIHVGKLAPSLLLERPRLSFTVEGRTAPELAATDDGFAVLGSLHDCDLGAPSCESAPVAATLLRTSPSLELVQRETLGFGGDVTPVGWGLHCSAMECFALTATAGSPSQVRAAEIRPRANAPRREAPAGPPKDAPRVTEIASVVTGESVVDLATARFGDASVIASLSAAAPPNGKSAVFSRDDDPAARTAGLVLATRVVDASGKAGAPIVLSTRALAVGGVSIAAAEKPDDGGVVAWVARENGDPEVHVTRVDKRGKRTNDVQLTTTKGDAADVSVVWAGGGWIVTWVDGRDGNGEVYATKVGLDLARVAREERITTAPGDASDLVALAKGDAVWLAWADSRESPKEGTADVYVTSLKMRDAKRGGGEVRVLATAAHSRTPHLALADDGTMHLAWIEEALLGLGGSAAVVHGALWAALDDDGKPKERPQRIPLAGEGAASTVAIDARGGALHAVVARSDAERVSLDTVLLAPGPPRAFSLLTLDGPPSLDVALVLEGDILLFNDDGPTPQDRRARRARLAWTP